MKNNQKGFTTHLVIVVLFIAVAGLGTFAFLNIRKQEADSKAKQAQIDQLKSDQTVPQDWEKYSLENGASVTLPKEYEQTQSIYGAAIFKDPSKEYDNTYKVDIAVHTASKPSINNQTFKYETYCQFNGTVWQSFINKDSVQSENTDQAFVDICSKITKQTSNGIEYYAFESMAKDSDHIALAVKSGDKFFVLNFQKYFNNYGIEAVKAVSEEQNKTMKNLVEKIATANR